LFEFLKNIFVKKKNLINTKDEIRSSKHFCILPWLHLHGLPDSRVLPCCVSDFNQTYGDLKKNSLKEVWNNSKFRSMRKLMLADKPVHSCRKCYELEESNVTTMRKRMNEKFINHSGLIKNTKEDGSLVNPKMVYLDFRFSNICNFKCRGCSPALSTKWYEDHQKLWEFKSDKPKLINATNDNPDLWSQLEEMLPTIEVAYFAGGEPLLMDEHYECLQFFIDHGMGNVELSYNTNLSILNFKQYDLISMWKKFKQIDIMVSVDEIEGRGEYFRSGLNWENLIKNLRTVQAELPDCYIHINCTISLFNISRIPEIHSYFYENDFINHDGLALNTLQDPIEYRSQLLPLKMKKEISKKLQNYIEQLDTKYPLSWHEDSWNNLINNVKNQITFMNAEDLEPKIPEFKILTQKLDKIRGEKFEEVFPDLKELF